MTKMHICIYVAVIGCQCFGHAESCVYNSTVADGGLSLNLNLEFAGGGVCQNCSDFTAGQYYIILEKPFSD